MPRTPRTRRLALFTASAALAAGGVLIPTTAFAAPASAQSGVVATQAPQEAKAASNGGGCGWDSDYEYWEYTEYYYDDYYYDDYYYTDCYDYGYYTDCWVY
ncbi:hypothetical protein [Streptomyces sp. NPDC026673]|uniref:hypothetical protein n=1 Tax=Streptomyces sp. NPDC026673 TaxID=3155724 RepID=UPI0033E76DD6